MSDRAAPELVVDGFPRKRPRWVELATSGDHKDLGGILLTGAGGFLFLAVIELVLMRLQLVVPENTFLSPVAFNRMLSYYGTTAIFFFALPFVFGLFLYVAPLQVGARGTALPRLSQIGVALWVAGAVVFYIAFLWTPSEAGINPLPPLSETAFLENNGVDVWITAAGFATLGFVFMSIDLGTTLRRMRAPGMAWRRAPVFAFAANVCCWLMTVIGPVFLAALTMLEIDRHYDGIFFADDTGGSPLLWQHLSWIFFTGVYMTILIFAFAAIAEIVQTFSRKPLFNRRTVMVSLAAVAVIGTLAWMQNMMTAPIGIGWQYFAMLMSLALIVPFGLLLYNLIATMVGGTLRMRSALLYSVGALACITVGLAAELQQSLVASAWQLHNTVDATAATHFALVGGAVFGGFGALHYWYPKITGRTMGEYLGRISFWTLVLGVVLTFVPLFFAGQVSGQVVDAYKYFGGTGVSFWNFVSTVGSFVIFIGIVLELSNAIASRSGGAEVGHDPWGGDSLEWFTLSPPDPHNFDVLPDIRSERPMRDIREAIARRTARREREARERQPVA
ncbi:MAG TPA: cbb3-type cytochrome c oxidase subunit I [Solirubrobacterales bacterium]|jgi:cytochrome c oxidase subunit 1